jgi:hypothetical protein
MPLFPWRHRTAARRRINTASPAGQWSSATLKQLAEPESTDAVQLATRMRLDYQVQLAELVLSANVQSVPVRIDLPEEHDDRTASLAGRLLQLFHDTLPSMLASLAEGRVAFEKVWDYDAGSDLTIIRKLEPLPASHTELKLGSAGEFKGVLLRGSPPVVLPPMKSWWLALDATASHPHGRSRFAGAPYETWKRRQKALRLRDVLLEKFALRGGIAHVPPTVETADGQVVDNFDATARAYTALQSGGLLLLPNSRDSRGQFDYEFTEAPATLDPKPIDASIDGMDAELLRAFGIPEKTVIEGHSVGSHAMVSQQMLVLSAVVEGVLRQFVNSFQSYVIDKVIEQNFEPDASPTLLLVFDSVVRSARKSATPESSPEDTSEDSHKDTPGEAPDDSHDDSPD